LRAFFLRYFAVLRPPRVISPSANKIKAFLPRIIVYWLVHVTRSAHGHTGLFAKRSVPTAKGCAVELHDPKRRPSCGEGVGRGSELIILRLCRRAAE
jgi:hypothetical protein